MLTLCVFRPFYQPEASLALFERVLAQKDIATGEVDLTGTYDTTGDEFATHTEPFVPLAATSAPATITSGSAAAAAATTTDAF